jgi:hypothetical protein
LVPAIAISQGESQGKFTIDIKHNALIIEVQDARFIFYNFLGDFFQNHVLGVFAFLSASAALILP